MHTAFDYAKYFMSKNLDNNPNTFDGNMKLQKLLVFAYLISLAKYGHPLFNDRIYAFTKGYVVENVRQRYQNDYNSLKAESEKYVPDFNEEEMYIIKCTIDIYGSLNAKELSGLSHMFDFWNDAYEKGSTPSGYHSKNDSIITDEKMMEEISAIKKVIQAYEQNNDSEFGSVYQCINGVKFFYKPYEIAMTDDLIDYLYHFAEDAEDNAYSVYYDKDNLVVY